MHSNINISSLNEKQQEAVISRDKRLLVLAGAGSGKTMTLLQKIVYLISKENVKSKNILAVTFTKNAANEMLDRLIISSDKSGLYAEKLANKQISEEDKNLLRLEFQSKHQWIKALTVRTFHSLCFKILREYGVNEFDNKFKILGDVKWNEDDEFKVDKVIEFKAKETVFEIFHKILIEQCDDENYLFNLKRYILDYFVDKIHINTDKRRSYDKLYTTLDGTKVRSKSEQFIADWFFRNNIRYVYEGKRQVTEKGFTFEPDFYLPDANIYIEHLSNKSSPISGKQAACKKAGFTVEYTYEKDTQDSALFSHILENIVKNRFSEKYKPRKSTYQEVFHGFHSHINEFIKMVNRVTDMIKVENIDLQHIKQKSEEDQHERVRNFYALALPVIQKFNAYCIDKSYLDFNDLIIRCISLLKNDKDIAKILKDRFKYVLVDEFQDVNSLQVEFIKLLLTDETQLFCVGDDWQSIYGFRGSDVSYIVEFEKHFNPSKVITLNINYRSTQNIVDAGNEVIKHNKFKIDKEIFAIKPSLQKIKLYSATEEDSSISETLSFCVDQIVKLQKEGYSSDDILFLYSRNHMFRPNFSDAFKEAGIKVQAKTIHAAKGLEAKVVFIIGLTDGSGGFPDIWLEDRIFQVIKRANHELLMEEQRRLFYVAVTRAKEKLFLISRKGNESRFIEEIPEKLFERIAKPIELIKEKVILCDKCSKQIKTTYSFCSHCGTPLNSKIE
ncbi:MAG: UvrD-helicase domain-containing protein [Bacteroidales bacterium]|jgi:superfamily I DNA/RNA helicase|nr:UvrD-helicase domain-containing protein [Bacteroidales bacterium]